MSVFFRAILGLSLAAALAACAGQPAPEPQALTETEVALREQEKAMAKFSAAMAKFRRVVRQRFLEDLKNIENCNLSDLLDSEKGNGGQMRTSETLEVELLLRGQCMERDAVKAAAILELELEKYPYHPDSLARLGGLYWTGDGVAENKERARELFGRAALVLGSLVIERPSPSYYRHQRDAEHWGEDPEKYRFSFAAPYWPPEPLPAPLQEEVDWLRKLEAGSGKAIFEVGISLRDGNNGFPRELVLSERWLSIAAYEFKHNPAFYPLAILMRELEYFELLKKYGLTGDRESLLISANRRLVHSATLDDHRADELILRLLRKAPDYPQKDRALYYFLLRLDRRGLIKDRSELPLVAARLDEQWRVAIENWASDTPLHTRLEATE